MTPPCRPPEEDDLHARLDGQLPRDRSKDVDAHLAAHPEIKARFSKYAAQRQALRAAFATQTGPDRLRVANIPAPALPPAGANCCSGKPARIGVPSAAGRCARLPALWLIAARSRRPHHHRRCDRRAPDVLGRGTPPVEVDAGQEAHLVQWLSKRLGRQLVMPDLTAAGLGLMGGGGGLPRTDPRPN
jgi:anti-sigma factor RsiW